MLTTITCLTVTCDGCNTLAEIDEGIRCHFRTETEAREWLGPDPHATADDDLTRWHFGTDATHLCPDCQCTAHGHVRYPHPDGPGATGRLGQFCLRCARPLTGQQTSDTRGDAA
jgi:hypothetical protein